MVSVGAWTVGALGQKLQQDVKRSEDVLEDLMLSRELTEEIFKMCTKNNNLVHSLILYTSIHTPF